LSHCTINIAYRKPLFERKLSGVFLASNQRKANTMADISFTLNGEKVEVSVEGSRPLLSVLRTELGLTGTKYGCGRGLCGACTVVVDNKAVRSCVYPARLAAGKDIVTIEGLAENGKLHPIQEAFARYDAFQCGYCTPGMIMNAYGLLLSNDQPSEEQIIDAMEGNLCRCGAHVRIVDALKTAAEQMKGAVR
jgi:aerobic-type carbon monoxide dehydrogenase small subunit (CoxS/CutS family)